MAHDNRCIRTDRPRHFHAIEVKTLPATNHRGTRVKLTSLRFKSWTIVPFGYQYSNSLDVAIATLTKDGFTIDGTAESKGGYLILTRTFHGFDGPEDLTPRD